MSTTASCLVKYRSNTHSIPAGSADGIKDALGALTGLTRTEMKLICSGKVLADADEVAAGVKLMLMRVAPRIATLRLAVREIVTGRLAPDVEVLPSMKHDDLISTLVKALLLPPCDEQTEVRIFLPHLGVLMRPDLALADYQMPSNGQPIGIFAVPCPKAPEPEQVTQIAHELKAASAQFEEQALSPEEATLALQELAVHATASLSPHDALAVHEALQAMLPAADDDKPAADSAEAASAKPTGPASAPPPAPSASFVLPPSLVDVAPTPSTAEVAASSSSTSERASAKATASLVPTRIRTGLMPAHDELPPVSIDRPVASLLAAELEAYEKACAPPTAEEWEAYVTHEETRLEERCADLIASLVPSLPSPPLARRREAKRGFGAGARGRMRRSRSAPLIARGSSAKAQLSQSARRATSDLDLFASSSTTTTSSNFAFSEDEEAIFDETSLCQEVLCQEVLCQEMDGPPHLPKGGKGGKVKGIACKGCGGRLPLTACATACKCGDNLCAKCSFDHCCPFDYKSKHESKLREENPKMEGPKLERM